MTIEHLLDELVTTRAAIAAYRDQEKQIIELIHEAAPKRKFEVAGLGLVQVATSRNRKWDNDDTMRHVVARALDERPIDPDTGELLDQRPTWEVVADVIMRCAGIGYWRVGALRDLGLDPDEFAETTSTSKSVRITPMVVDS